MIRLFVTDIDNTLYDSINKVIPANNIAAVQHLIDCDIPVALATARIMHGALPVMKELELDRLGGYVIASNGAHILDCKTGKDIYNARIRFDQVQRMLDFALAHGVQFAAEQDDIVLATGYDEGLEDDRVTLKLDYKILGEPEKLVSYLDHEPMNCSFTGTPAQLDAIYEKAVKEFPDMYVCRSNQIYIDLVAAGVNKAAGIKRLVAMLNTDMDHVAAIGDSENDRWMLEHSGLSACVLEGDPEIKKLADYEACSFTEGALADFIENKVLSYE